MGESSVEALDSSTQEDGPPLGEAQQHPRLSTYFNYSWETLGAQRPWPKNAAKRQGERAQDQPF